MCLTVHLAVPQLLDRLCVQFLLLHATLIGTSAMAADLTDHCWSLRTLSVLLSAEVTPRYSAALLHKESVRPLCMSVATALRHIPLIARLFTARYNSATDSQQLYEEVVCDSRSSASDAPWKRRFRVPMTFADIARV
jgi:hypothetical protein